MSKKNIFVSSIVEMKSVKVIAAIGMLIALSVVLSFFTIPVGNIFKVSFVFIANELTGMLFGPIPGAVMGALSDIIKWAVKPTGAFFPGYTLSGILGGLIYGIVLYRKPFSIWRVAIANTLVSFFVNLLLNTLWVTTFTGNPYMVQLKVRAIPELCTWILDIILFSIIAIALGKTGIFKLFDKQEFFVSKKNKSSN